MPNEINILKSDLYTAVYVNGTKTLDFSGGADVKELLDSVLEALQDSKDKSLPVIREHDGDFDFDWDKIWVNGDGFVDNWETVENARNEA